MIKFIFILFVFSSSKSIASYDALCTIDLISKLNTTTFQPAEIAQCLLQKTNMQTDSPQNDRALYISAFVSAVIASASTVLFTGLYGYFFPKNVKNMFGKKAKINSFIPWRIKNSGILCGEIEQIDSFLVSQNFTRKPLSQIQKTSCYKNAYFLGFKYINQKDDLIEIMFNPKHMDKQFKIDKKEISDIVEQTFSDISNECKCTVDNNTGDIESEEWDSYSYKPTDFNSTPNSIYEFISEKFSKYVDDESAGLAYCASSYSNNKQQIVLIAPINNQNNTTVIFRIKVNKEKYSTDSDTISPASSSEEFFDRDSESDS